MRARAALHALRPDDAPPITTAINEARRQARRHLETAGATVSQRRRVDDHSDPADFVLPPDLATAALNAAGGSWSASSRTSGLAGCW
jgi:hypothetical protein